MWHVSGGFVTGLNDYLAHSPAFLSWYHVLYFQSLSTPMSAMCLLPLISSLKTLTQATFFPLSYNTFVLTLKCTAHMGTSIIALYGISFQFSVHWY